jgi:hypothetical protein
MSKSTANRRIDGLIKSGWFDVIEPAKRGKGGLWIPAKLRPLSPAEYQQRYSGVCKKAVDDVGQKLKEIGQCAEQACSAVGTGYSVEGRPVSVGKVRVPSHGDPVPPIDHPVPNQTATWPAGGTEIECKTEIESEIKTENKVEVKTVVSADISDVYFSDSQHGHKSPPEEAAISRAHVAAPPNVSNTQAQNAEGLLATNQAHVAAGTSDASGPNHAEVASSHEPDLYRTITTKFGVRFDGHTGEWQHAETGWEVSREHLEPMFKSIGVERKQAWDAWAQTEGRPFFEPRHPNKARAS